MTHSTVSAWREVLHRFVTPNLEEVRLARDELNNLVNESLGSGPPDALLQLQALLRAGYEIAATNELPFADFDTCSIAWRERLEALLELREDAAMYRNAAAAEHVELDDDNATVVSYGSDEHEAMKHPHGTEEHEAMLPLHESIVAAIKTRQLTFNLIDYGAAAAVDVVAACVSLPRFHDLEPEAMAALEKHGVLRAADPQQDFGDRVAAFRAVFDAVFAAPSSIPDPATVPPLAPQPSSRPTTREVPGVWDEFVPDLVRRAYAKPSSNEPTRQELLESVRQHIRDGFPYQPVDPDTPLHRLALTDAVIRRIWSDVISEGSLLLEFKKIRACQASYRVEHGPAPIADVVWDMFRAASQHP